MGLTEEQKERIRKNRERALEIQKRRREQEQHEFEERKKSLITSSSSSSSSSPGQDNKQDSGGTREAKRQRVVVTPGRKTNDGVVAGGGNKGNHNIEQDDVELEEFEVGASDLITKKEAMKMYCLPEGTIAVCKVVQEKPNPRHKTWAPMKLYSRSEIRRRARKRFGGMDGLVEERRKREEKRFRNDLHETKDLFR